MGVEVAVAAVLEVVGCLPVPVPVAPLVAVAAGGIPPACPSALPPLPLFVFSIEAIIFLNTLGAVLSSPISSLCASAAPRPRWRTRGASRDRHWAEASRTW